MTIIVDGTYDILYYDSRTGRRLPYGDTAGARYLERMADDGGEPGEIAVATRQDAPGPALYLAPGAHEWAVLPPEGVRGLLTTEYEAYRYAGEGRGGEIDAMNPDMSDGAVIARGSLEDCRLAIASRLLKSWGRRPTDAECRWHGTDDDVEAYHEGSWEGCGGWAIRPVRP
jgi:hypothetical protein